MLTAIPRKKGEKVNIEKPIMSYASSNYDDETISRLQPLVAEMAKKRVSAINSLDKTEGIISDALGFLFFSISALRTTISSSFFL